MEPFRMKLTKIQKMQKPAILFRHKHRKNTLDLYLWRKMFGFIPTITLKTGMFSMIKSKLEEWIGRNG